MMPFPSGATTSAATFQRIWPNAVARDMPAAAFLIQLRKPAGQAAPQDANEAEEERLRELRQTLQESDYLGRNSAGHRVFAGRSGRFVATESDALLYESDSGRGTAAMFLRAGDEEGLVDCAYGFIRSIELGEVQREGDLERFIGAVLPQAGPGALPGAKVRRALEEAKFRYLQERYETAVEAWGDAIRLTEYMAIPPGRGQDAWLPLPLSLAINQALGLHQDARAEHPAGEREPRRIHLGGDLTGAGALMVPSDITVVGSDDVIEHALPSTQAVLQRDDGSSAGLDFMVLQTNWQHERTDAVQNLRDMIHQTSRVRAGGGVALVSRLSEGTRLGILSAEQRELLDGMRRQADVEAILDVPAALTRSSGVDGGVRLVIAAPLRTGQQARAVPAPKACHSWDELKTVIDELLISRGQRPSSDDLVRISDRTLENELQRPYVAFSRVGEARTMVPKNLQASLNYALARVEEEQGSMDEYVAYELGMGMETLAERFSAEQVDGIGMMISRLQKGRGVIVGDDTGIGKGRQIAASAVWANKQGRPVIFVTDRANLFSDLARDLIDIDEWARFRPMPLNSDGHILDIMADNEVLVTATSTDRMNSILEQGLSFDAVGVNLVMLTYSQISREDSAKAAWLLTQCPDALVILDEAHIAAGSDSNTADYVRMLSERSWGVVYATATWAKTARNLHIYVRAFPESINIGQVTAAMKRGGEEFAEVFSSMLARDGAFYRREHDLSKLEANVLVDDQHFDRNRAILTQVSEILGMMSLLSGEVEQLLHRANSATRGALRAAHEARTAWVAQAKENLENLDRRIQDLAQRGEVDALATVQDERRRLVEQIGRPIAKGSFFQSSFSTGGILYQAMRRTLAVLMADATVDRAVESIRANRRPVIIFDDTGEALVRRFIEEERERIEAAIAAREGDVDVRALADQLSSQRRTSVVPDVRMPMLKDLMHSFLKRLGGVKMQESDDPEAGGAGESSVISISAVPGVSDGQVEAYRRGVEAIMARVESLPDLPISPADYIRVRLEEAGYRVGEVSGRQFALHRPNTVDDSGNPYRGFAGPWRVVKRARKKTDVMATVRAFNDGRIDVALLNRAGATGVSMHASPRFLNQDRRELIEYQIQEDPTSRLQLYGRVNRFDQVVGPMLSIMTTGLRGELRNLMMQNRKLAGLSVNVRSSRENAALIDDVPDMLNSVGDEVCEEYLLENPGVMSRLSIDVARVKERAGLANLVTQRIALLHPDDQDKVYDDLFAAYDDALVRRELSGEGSANIRNRDWRARTVEEERAWGPSGEVPQELFSAFDGPVFLRTVEYVKDYQPIGWGALKETIAESNAALVANSKAKFLPLASHVAGRSMVVADYAGEQNETLDVRRGRQARDVLQQLQQAASVARSEGPERAGQTGMAGVRSDWRAALAGAWVPVRIRRGGQNVYDRFVAYVPRRAPYIPMWQVKGDSGGELRLRLDQDEAVSLQVVGRRTPSDGVTWVEMFKRAYLPQDERLRQISIASIVENAGRILEGKRIIAMQRTDWSTIDEALSQPEDNGVKEAHWRLLFLRSVMAELVPGTELTLREIAGSSTQTFWSVGDTMTVAKVEIPSPEDAAVFSKWKYHLVRPGDEKPTVLTAASLFKRAGMAPDFAQVEVGKTHMFDFDARGETARLERRFGDHTPGPVTMRRKLLTGNLFQAAEWAEATKAGMAITYTDETGQRHRAIQVRATAFGRQDINLHRLPIRLHNPLMITDFLHRTLDWAAALPPNDRQVARTLQVPMSFKAAMHEGDRRQSLIDLFGIAPYANEGRGAVAFGVEKREKARFVRMVKSAMEADRRDWETDNPEEPYPLSLTAQAARTPREQEDTTLMFSLPEGREARTRFIAVVIRAVGLQLYVRPQDLKLAELARQSEVVFFQEVAERLAPERQRLLDAQTARRERNRELVGDSFDSAEAESNAVAEHGAGAEDSQHNLALSAPQPAGAQAQAM
ncbi:strawberry notch C-terminal domain-containing protein (plasmid) [Achromobacter seleniivolatilans]|uniref:Strawberry notch C-terminal domain-containing protein n=1 Tax=Achromobacter seleniivolatilans TaxID=3047478 RepID=A0ABY9MAG3_9BURK|nr:strawberry notch C-terminal domain-containing protein [Achromobacter sp. R39]WMD23979.1 strawberry notch C-terminal domain-containing protein [Achromobacter sp. R39]